MENECFKVKFNTFKAPIDYYVDHYQSITVWINTKSDELQDNNLIRIFYPLINLEQQKTEV